MLKKNFSVLFKVNQKKFVVFQFFAVLFRFRAKKNEERKVFWSQFSKLFYVIVVLRKKNHFSEKIQCDKKNYKKKLFLFPINISQKKDENNSFFKGKFHVKKNHVKKKNLDEKSFLKCLVIMHMWLFDLVG